MSKFRRKPVILEATQFKGDINIHPDLSYNNERGFFSIQTKRGPAKIEKGDWIVLGIEGCYYPVRGKIFNQLYERVE